MKASGNGDMHIPVQRRESLLAFQALLGIEFSDLGLLDRALTHRSFLNESPSAAGDNERLEFLGDAVLGQAAALLLYRLFPDTPEGGLARIKSVIVSEPVLAPIADSLGLAGLIRLGRGEELSGGRGKRAILADALEALIGAIFLDAGQSAAHAFIASLLEPVAAGMASGVPGNDYKTALQEYAQKFLKSLPRYVLDRAEGPEHARRFWVSCTLGTSVYGPVPGSTKKEAEQAAARAAWDSLQASGGAESERLLAIRPR